MKIAAASCLIVAVVLAACSSSSGDEAQEQQQPASEETRVEGLYKRTEGASNIEFVLFEADGKYKMAIDGAPRLDEGTYAFNDAKTSVTFHSESDPGRGETKFDLAIGAAAVGSGGSGLLKPSGGFVTPGAGLVKPADSVQLNGKGYQLVGFDFFCKDAKLISPNSSNCSGAQLGCPGGQVACIKYGPRPA
jgi:hypothetical protein